MGGAQMHDAMVHMFVNLQQQNYERTSQCRHGHTLAPSVNSSVYLLSSVALIKMQLRS
jgi:hypothetical protein